MATTATDNIPAICRNRGRPEEPCGIYRISHVYWQDALRIIDPDDSLARGNEYTEQKCLATKLQQVESISHFSISLLILNLLFIFSFKILL